MEVIEAIKIRRSIRDFSSKPLSKEIIEQLIDAGRRAPSACNRQPWRFVCVMNGEVRSRLIEAYDREWIKSAPAVIVVVADHAMSWHRPADGKDAADIDAAIAIDHITLRAVELGLGTCWVCNFDASLVCRTLKIGADEEPIALLPVGYPTPEALLKERTERKSLDMVCSFVE